MNPKSPPSWHRRACTAFCTLLLAATCVPTKADIFINEVDADQTGTDAAEFVELYNSGDTTVTLTDYALVFYNGNGDTAYSSISLSSLTIPAGGFVVIGNTGVTNVSSVTFAGNFLQNGQDAVALFSGVPVANVFTSAPGNAVATFPAGAVLVDAVVYDITPAFDAALIDALTPGQNQINEGTSGGGGTAQFNAIARLPDGGTRLNTSTYIAQSPTPGTSNSGGSTTPVLTLAVAPDSFLEDAGAAAATGTVTRTGSTAAALTVALTSANTEEATVPATVEIAAGQTQQTFTVAAVDDLVSDGPKTFNLTAAATGFTTVNKSITVTDNEPALPALELTFSESSVVEGGIIVATIARPLDAPSTALVVTISSGNPAKATADSPTVTIAENDLAAFINITAVDDEIYSSATPVIFTVTASGYATDTATLTVTDNDPAPPFGPPTVVVNKFSNSSPELIELLVTGNGTPGTTVDMRRMVIKDFSGSMANDGGQGFRFADTAFFSAIKVGTLIVLSNSSTSEDTSQTAAGDYTLKLGLTDTVYFTAQTGTSGFDIAATEMVMIKRQDAEFQGVAGSIHALATGVEGTQFTLTPESKLISSTSSNTNNGVIALNSTSSLTDFNGTDATGNVPLNAAAFGIANDFATSGPNSIYIQNLRGITNINGTGIARSFANTTPGSPYAGVNIFPRNATGQTVSFSLFGTVDGGTLAGFKVTVPGEFGGITATNVSVTGDGAGTPVVSVDVTGQVVTVTGTAITPVNPAIIALSGLATPNPTAITDAPSYPFALQTSQGGTVFASTGVTPSAAVLIPISALRDVDASGVPVDLGKLIAIEGVCTEAQFSNNAAGDTTAFFQDGDFGLGLFISATALNLERGKRYALTGPLSQFNGLSQISLPVGSSANIIDRGPGTEPTPITLTLAELTANAELYEGRVVKVLSLGTPSGNWATGSTVTLSDSNSTTIQVRIQAGSAATEPPASYPVNITGILSQFDSSNPFNSAYQLQPRELADVEVVTVAGGYETWAAGFPGIGSATDDADGDGQSNFLEYALGTIPNSLASAQQPDLTPINGKPAFSITKGTEAAADPSIQYVIEGSSDLVTWFTSGDDLDIGSFGNTLAARYLGTSNHYFFRLKILPATP